MHGSLKGIRVLDLGSYIAAPYCCMLLADHGAEVIRAEPPGGKVDREMGPFSPDGQPMTYGYTVQRNKKDITLNLRSEKGQKLLDELVKKADIVVHNNPMGTLEADLLTYERLSAINPAIIVVAVSGFGQTGPYAKRVCFDAIAQAMSGVMSFSGFPGNPPLKASVPFVDFNTAARAALGAMMALYERTISGKGQLVDIALFDVAFSMTGAMGCPQEYKLLGEVRKPVGNCGFYGYVGSCKTTDGYICICVLGNNQWRRICRVIKREDLIGDPRFKDNLTRYRHYLDIDKIVEEWTKDKTTAQCVQKFEGAGVPCGPVNNVPQSLEVPQIPAREMLVEVDYPVTGKVPLPGVSIKMSRTPGKIARRASAFGEDNEDVYCGLLGYSREDVAKLKEEKAI